MHITMYGNKYDSTIFADEERDRQVLGHKIDLKALNRSIRDETMESNPQG